MFRKSLWVLLGLVIVLPVAAGIAAVKLHQFRAMGDAAAAQVMPPEPVNSVDVKEQEWQPRISAVGSVVAVRGTELSSEAEGVVRSIRFADGAHVKTGEVLIELDSHVEKAQLLEAQAAAELAVLTFKRNQKLAESRNISKEEQDTAQSNMKQALAKVENLQAVIDKKLVKAPFDGKVGIRRVAEGGFLQKGAPIVSLQSLDPIHVEFSLPQQRLGELSEGLKVAVSSDAYPGKTYKGKITAINPDIDVKTRNVRVQATLPNPEGQLRPGMYVSIETSLARSERLLFIPSTAVLYAPYGDSVFVIEDSSTSKTVSTAASPAQTSGSLTLRQQFVRLGAKQGDFVAVTEGLKAGDRIVSTGVFKLKPGTAVVVDNKLAPTFSFNPKPGNT